MPLYGPGGPNDGGDVFSILVRNLSQLIDNLLAHGLDGSIFSANTMLKADVDDVPVAFEVPPSMLVGRKATGGIGPISPAEAGVMLQTQLDVSSAAAVATHAGLADPHPGYTTQAELDAFSASTTTALAGKAPATGIAQSAVANLVTDLVAKASKAGLPILASDYVPADPTADATAGLQAFVNALCLNTNAPNHGILAPRKYKITGYISIPASTRWTLEAYGALFEQQMDNTPCLMFVGDNTNTWKILGGRFTWLNQQTVTQVRAIGIAFQGTGTFNGYYNGRISDISGNKGYSLVCNYDAPSVNGPVWGLTIDKITGDSGMVGPLVSLRQDNGGSPNISIRDLYAIRSGGAGTMPGIWLKNAQVVKLDNIEFNTFVGSEMILDSCTAVEIGVIRSEQNASIVDQEAIWRLSACSGRISNAQFLSPSMNVPAGNAYLMQINSYSRVEIGIITVQVPVTVTAGNLWMLQAGGASPAASVSIGSVKRPYAINAYYGFDSPLTWTRVRRADGIRAMGAPALPALKKVETFSRIGARMEDVFVLANTRMQCTMIFLEAGFWVSSITYYSFGTAAGTPLHQFFALYSLDLGSGLPLLGQTPDDTTTPWAAHSAKTLSLVSPYEIQSDGYYYIGVSIDATVMPTFAGVTEAASAGWGAAPIINGYSTSGLGATAPNPAAALTRHTSVPYAHVQ